MAESPSDQLERVRVTIAERLKDAGFNIRDVIIDPPDDVGNRRVQAVIQKGGGTDKSPIVQTIGIAGVSEDGAWFHETESPIETISHPFEAPWIPGPWGWIAKQIAKQIAKRTTDAIDNIPDLFRDATPVDGTTLREVRNNVAQVERQARAEARASESSIPADPGEDPHASRPVVLDTPAPDARPDLAPNNPPELDVDPDQLQDDGLDPESRPSLEVVPDPGSSDPTWRPSIDDLTGLPEDTIDLIESKTAVGQSPHAGTDSVSGYRPPDPGLSDFTPVSAVEPPDPGSVATTVSAFEAPDPSAGSIDPLTGAEGSGPSHPESRLIELDVAADGSDHFSGFAIAHDRAPSDDAHLHERWDDAIGGADPMTDALDPGADPPFEPGPGPW